MVTLYAIKQRVKEAAHYKCIECGERYGLELHHTIPGDDSTLVVLCAKCHHAKHPNMPLDFFLKKTVNRYWSNISSARLAREIGIKRTTLVNWANRLGIEKAGELSSGNEILLRKYRDTPHNVDMVKLNREIKKCNRCGWIWYSRIARPFQCPKCKTSLWWSRRKFK